MKKNFFKKVSIFLIIAIVISAPILTKELNNLDELWNYNFAKNMLDGKLPYKDFNIIQMPLLPILCGLILKIFGNELIVMRIIAIILNTLILVFTLKILELLKINRYAIYFFLAIIYLFYYQYFCIDYNFAILLIVLISIYLELKLLIKNNNVLQHNYKYDILLGLIIGTSILFKHTIGIILTLICIFYKILVVSNMQEWKETSKIVCARILGAIIPITMIIIYFFKANIYYDFLNYAIYGIKTFSNKISYLSLLKNYRFEIAILSIIVPITIIYMYFIAIVKKQKMEEQKHIFVLFAYSVGIFAMIFPISDAIHFLIGSLPAMIALYYMVYTLIKNKLTDKSKISLKKYAKIITVFIVSAVIIVSIAFIIKYIFNLLQFSSLKHYKFIPSTLDNNITKIDNYILQQNSIGRQVYILDATACLYMIPLDKYNKDYDMFLKGNLGSKGEQGQIEKLKNSNNTIVLIMNDNFHRNWQNPETVRKYIIEEWQKIGQIGNFDIYEGVDK